MEEHDGGSAFPRSGYRFNADDVDAPVEGMSLLDYFAAQALAGLMHQDIGGIAPVEDPYGFLASHAYLAARAMLAERAKAREQPPREIVQPPPQEAMNADLEAKGIEVLRTHE